jgi:hypothetical protein
MYVTSRAGDSCKVAGDGSLVSLTAASISGLQQHNGSRDYRLSADIAAVMGFVKL